MANVFLTINQTGYNIANNNDNVYGQSGFESVVIQDGKLNTTVDQNIEQLTLSGSVADYTYLQQGNRLLVYSGTDLVATIPVQVDLDGTLLTFDEEGTYNVMFGAGSVLQLGGSAVPSGTAGAVVPVDDPADPVVPGDDDDDDDDVDGQDFWLTAMADRLPAYLGTEGDDIYRAPLDSNLIGQVTNSLQSSDVLDGNGGRNELWADLLMESGNFYGGEPRAIEPDTKNIQELYLNARETYFWDDFVDQNVVINARKMLDVDYIESHYSDADLTVRGLTTNTSEGPNTRLSDITVSMDHTSGRTVDTGPIWDWRDFIGSGEGSGDWDEYFDDYYINGKFYPSSMKVLFEQNYLVPGQKAESQAIYYLLDQNADQIGGPLLDRINTNGLIFTVNGGPTQVIDFDPALLTGDVVNTHAEFIAALQPALDALIAAGTVPADTILRVDPTIPDFTFLDNGAQSSPIPAIVLETQTTDVLTAVGFQWVQELVGNYNVYGELASEADISDQPLTINIELEKVGRGEDGGGMIVGGDNYTKGFDIFEVTVKGNEDMPSSLAYLLSTPHDGLDTLNIYSEDRTDGSYADLQIGNANTPIYSIIDLNNIDATQFLGNLDINQALVVNGGEYDYRFGIGDDALELAIIDFDNQSAEGVAFDIDMGAGADDVFIILDTDAVDTVGDYLSIVTQGNDDSVVIISDPPELLQNSASQRTMFLLDNMDISTGAGEDDVYILGRARFNIHAGNDSDFVEIDSATANIPAPWSWWSFGNETGLQPFVNRVLYQAELTVMFAGFESKVLVNTVAANKYIATQLDINDAIVRAVMQSPEQLRMLGFTEEDGLQELEVWAAINGNNELAVSLYQPELIQVGPAAAGQLLINNSQTAQTLAQGLIQTTDLDSTAFWAGAPSAFVLADLIDEFNNGTSATATNIGAGSIDEFGDVATAGTAGLGDLGRGKYDFLIPTPDGANNLSGNLDLLNHSEINMGAGANDLLVLDSADLSANTLIVDQTFGKVSVVNFFNSFNAYDDVGENVANVGMHALDFTYFLNNQIDVSADNGNTWSRIPLDITLNTDAPTEANSVTFLQFDSTNTDDNTFAGLTAAQLVARLNGTDGAGVNGIGDVLDADNLAGNNPLLVGTTLKHIILVENDLNLGEFKVFYVQSTVVNADAGDFNATGATLLGTIDFGYGFGVANLDPLADGAEFYNTSAINEFTEINLIGTAQSNLNTQAWLDEVM